MTSTRGGPPLDDTDLIARSARGDEEAYAALVSRYSDVAFRTAYLLTRSAAEAEEAAQDGFLAAFRALPRFRAGSAFRPWLLRIVGNAARNRRRAASRRVTAELRLTEAPLQGGAAPSPEAEAEVAEERRALLRVLGTLDAVDRDVLSCRYLLELDVAETAAVLDCAVGTVKSRTSRALARLRERLEAEGVTA